jgi:hypothetical protein
VPTGAVASLAKLRGAAGQGLVIRHSTVLGEMPRWSAICRWLMGPEPAQHEDVPQLLGHAQDDVFQGEGFDLGERGGAGLRREQGLLVRGPEAVSPIAVDEEVSGDLKQEGLRFHDLDGRRITRR